MTGCGFNATPLCAEDAGCVMIASFAAGPGSAVAWSVTLGAPDTETVSVWGPAPVPRVHEVSVATPLALLVTGEDGATVPLLPAGAKVTATLGTGLLLASMTRTDGAALT